MKDTTIPAGVLKTMQDFYDKDLLKSFDQNLVHEPMGTEDTETDPVHPSHYKLPNGMQVIDVEVAMFGKEWVQHHCICTAVEYLLRHMQKNGTEDVKKASWWVQHYLKLAEEEA